MTKPKKMTYGTPRDGDSNVYSCQRDYLDNRNPQEHGWMLTDTSTCRGASDRYLKNQHEYPWKYVCPVCVKEYGEEIETKNIEKTTTKAICSICGWVYKTTSLG